MGYVFLLCQAEDGIRELVRSRGLGEVYKRQAYIRVDLVERRGEFCVRGGIVDLFPPTLEHPVRAVSYTHLTLPTSDLV